MRSRFFVPPPPSAGFTDLRMSWETPPDTQAWSDDLDADDGPQCLTPDSGGSFDSAGDAAGRAPWEDDDHPMTPDAPVDSDGENNDESQQTSETPPPPPAGDEAADNGDERGREPPGGPSDAVTAPPPSPLLLPAEDVVVVVDVPPPPPAVAEATVTTSRVEAPVADTEVAVVDAVNPGVAVVEAPPTSPSSPPPPPTPPSLPTPLPSSSPTTSPTPATTTTTTDVAAAVSANIVAAPPKRIRKRTRPSTAAAAATGGDALRPADLPDAPPFVLDAARIGASRAAVDAFFAEHAGYRMELHTPCTLHLNASARPIAAALGMENETAVVPSLVRRYTAPQVSVFDIVERLDLDFSVGNAAVLQEVLVRSLRRFRDNTRAEAVPMVRLLRSRAAVNVFWNHQKISVTTWPAERTDDLAGAARLLLVKMRYVPPPQQPQQPHACRVRALRSFDDLCPVCVALLTHSVSAGHADLRLG